MGTTDREHHTRGWALLVAIASASAAVYALALTRPMWLLDHYARPHMDTPRILGVSNGSLLQFLLAFGILFTLYLAAIRVSSDLRAKSPAVGVLTMGGVLALPAVLMHPGGAGDVYMYIAWADAALRYGENPFGVPPSALPEYPLLPFLDFPQETVQYGPLWLGLSLIVRLLAGDSLLAALLAFKIAAAASLLLLAWIVYLAVRVRSPGRAVPAMLMVAWNPALIFELGGNAHNDVVMAVLVALAFYLYWRGSPRLSVLSLMAAVMVKYVAIVLLPLFLADAMRNAGHPRNWLPRVSAFSLGLLASGLLLLRLVGIEGTVGVLLDRTDLFTTSISAVARLWLARYFEPERVELVILRLAQLAFAAYLLFETGRVWRYRADLAHSSLRVTIALMLLVISWYQPWYSTWAIPLAALSFSRKSLAVGVALGIGAVLIHAVMGFGWRLEWHRGDFLTIQTLGTLAAWLPVALAVLVSVAAHRVTRPPRLLRGLGSTDSLPTGATRAPNGADAGRRAA